MFDSSVLDVVIGLVFCFASVALLVSAVNEAIASALKLRHKSLVAGIKKLLNDAQGTGLVVKLYNHALVSPLAPGKPSTALSTVLPGSNGRVRWRRGLHAGLPHVDAPADRRQIWPGRDSRVVDLTLDLNR